jgi:hypothetical protein
LRVRPRKGAFASLATAVGALAILGLGISSAAGAIWFVIGSTDRDALTQLSSVLLVGLQSENYDVALAACAEGEPGAQMLADEDREVFVPAADSPENRAAAARDARAESLAVLRMELAQLGVQWNDITPLAFGGVRARVRQDELMTRPVTAVTGHLYFLSGGSLFAVELSARKCGRAYFITEIWNWARLDADPLLETAETHSSDQFRAFKDANDPDTANISRARRVFQEF